MENGNPSTVIRPINGSVNHGVHLSAYTEGVWVRGTRSSAHISLITAKQIADQKWPGVHPANAHVLIYRRRIPMVLAAWDLAEHLAGTQFRNRNFAPTCGSAEPRVF